jgi:hypothetical protein
MRRSSSEIFSVPPSGTSSEALGISKGDCDPIAERIQEIIFSLAALVAHPKAFDLFDQISECAGRPASRSRLERGSQ